MTVQEMSDNDFIQFQDDFYNLLEKYGVSSIDCEHEEFAEILNLRDNELNEKDFTGLIKGL